MKIKRILLSFILLISLIIGGCGNKNYINNVKSLTFDNGLSMNELVQGYLKGGESYILNPDYRFLGAKYGLSLLPYTIMESQDSGKKFSDSDFAVEISTFLKNLNYKEISNIKPKWEVQGKTSTGKIITAKSKNILVKIPIIEDGDYISTYKEDIEIFNLNTNQKIDKETARVHNLIIIFLEEINKN